MAYKFQQGNKAYIVDNARFLREVIILVTAQPPPLYQTTGKREIIC